MDHQKTIKQVCEKHDVPTCKTCLLPGQNPEQENKEDLKFLQMEVRGITSDSSTGINTTYACPRCDTKVTMHDAWPKSKKKAPK